MNIEIIEYKSEGHPDTLTDLTVEECASFLDSYYLEMYGKVMHYNVDKAVLLAGEAIVTYNEYRIKKRPCFILGGQVSFLTQELKSELKKVIFTTIKKYLPNCPDIDIEIRCNNVSSNLAELSLSDEVILANDTSFGVGYYPYSKNEKIVLAIKEELDFFIATQFFPIGELYKIMFTPKTITISSPLYVQKVHSNEEYLFIKKSIEEHFSKYGNVLFNPDFDNGFPYLSITGSSIECGDDGQVGRGNRYNNLITPSKIMTIEAYHGKNNKNHVGKLYSKWAFQIAQKLYEQTGKYTEVILISKIGKPINDYESYVEQHEI